jgi:SAM-dependent methyltransferase
MAGAATSYDEVAYPTRARGWTHPDRLAVIASLAGMTPAAPSQARVLEVGCGDGANLMGIAFHYPGARVAGFDLAAAPLERGRRLAARLGLRNLELRHADLLDFRPGEQFDYIIAHGVYSWVPEAVRARILQLCHDCLAPQGVAYISYNVLPGWYFRLPVRDLMLFHTGDIADPAAKLAASSDIAAWMAQSSPENDYGRVLRDEVRGLAECDAGHIYHDDLSPVNEPLYLHQFLAAAAGHGLQYVADADSLLAAALGSEATKAAPWAGDDMVRAEQYLDFLRLRRFRQSILCHEGVALDRRLASLKLQNLHAASSITAEPEQPDGTQRFRLHAGCAITTNQPFVKNLLTTLGAAWPSTRPLAEFTGWHENRENILMLFASDALRLRATPVSLPRLPGVRPQVSLLARAEVETGSPFATNPYHFMMDVREPFLRALLPLLDGTRDRAALISELAAAISSGRLSLGEDAPRDEEALAAMLAAYLDKAFDGFGLSALLV